MKSKSFLAFWYCVTFLLAYSCVAQSSDLFRVEGLNIPKNDAGITTTRFKGVINVPFEISKETYLIIGSEYNFFNIKYDKEFSFDTEDLERLHILDLNIGYITKWNENWRLILILTPRLASNFSGSTLSDDFFFNATGTLLKSVNNIDKPFRIVAGLSFNSTTGLPFPLPIVSYYKKFHPNWSYTLGTTRSNLRYHWKKQSLQLALLLDGYFINVQNNIELPQDKVGSKLSLSAVVSGLEYQYKITKEFSFFAVAGQTLYQSAILRGDNQQRVFTLNEESNLYFRTGFKLSIF